MGSIKNLGIYREQNNLTHQCMETEDIGLVVYAKLEQRPPFTYLIYHATWIKRVWAYTHQPNYPNIAFLSKPLKFPPIIFCYWNWCLFVSLCHGLLWVRGSNSYKTWVCIWVWCVIMVRGFPQPHLIQAIVSPVLTWMLTILNQNLSCWCRVNPIYNSVPIPSSLLFSDKTRFMSQPLEPKDES